MSTLLIIQMRCDEFVWIRNSRTNIPLQTVLRAHVYARICDLRLGCSSRGAVVVVLDKLDNFVLWEDRSLVSSFVASASVASLSFRFTFLIRFFFALCPTRAKVDLSWDLTPIFLSSSCFHNIPLFFSYNKKHSRSRNMKGLSMMVSEIQRKPILGSFLFLNPFPFR